MRFPAMRDGLIAENKEDHAPGSLRHHSSQRGLDTSWAANRWRLLGLCLWSPNLMKGTHTSLSSSMSWPPQGLPGLPQSCPEKVCPSLSPCPSSSIFADSATCSSRQWPRQGRVLFGRRGMGEGRERKTRFSLARRRVSKSHPLLMCIRLLPT